ncbi:hypothetical protein HDU76_009728, partial [Blyttiomyces sp. JEL0837]
MTDLSFLVNRFNSLGTNPYQLAYSAVGLQNLISKEICHDLEDYVNAVHANQVGIADSESEMDYIHISGNSILRSSYGDARKQYPLCDSFENDTMSFLVTVTDDNAGTEICCQDISFRCPFNPEDPFGASYNTD